MKKNFKPMIIKNILIRELKKKLQNNIIEYPRLTLNYKKIKLRINHLFSFLLLVRFSLDNGPYFSLSEDKRQKRESLERDVT